AERLGELTREVSVRGDVEVVLVDPARVDGDQRTVRATAATLVAAAITGVDVDDEDRDQQTEDQIDEDGRAGPAHLFKHGVLGASSRTAHPSWLVFTSRFKSRPIALWMSGIRSCIRLSCADETTRDNSARLNGLAVVGATAFEHPPSLVL